MDQGHLGMNVLAGPYGCSDTFLHHVSWAAVTTGVGCDPAAPAASGQMAGSGMC